jgi:hypothetical protein
LTGIKDYTTFDSSIKKQNAKVMDEIQVIDFNENSWAVIGDVTPILDSLKEFAEQKKIDYYGARLTVWIVSKQHSDRLSKLILEA